MSAAGLRLCHFLKLFPLPGTPSHTVLISVCENPSQPLGLKSKAAFSTRCSLNIPHFRINPSISSVPTARGSESESLQPPTASPSACLPHEYLAQYTEMNANLGKSDEMPVAEIPELTFIGRKVMAFPKGLASRVGA